MKQKTSIKKNKIKFILIILLILIIIKIVFFIVKNRILVEEVIYSGNQEKENYKVSKDLSSYNIIDLVKHLANNEEEIVTFQNKSKLKYVIDDEKIYIDVGVENFQKNSTYTVIYGAGNKLKEESMQQNKTIEIQLETEGKNQCYVAVKKEGEVLEGAEWNFTEYYIKSYNKQFLDELENKGVGVHLTGTLIEKFIPIYKALGSQYIRVDLMLTLIYKNNKFVYDIYDGIVKTLMDNEVKMLAILGVPGGNLGTDKIVSSDEELNFFNTYVESVATHYPEITDYEIWNEPNAVYKTDAQIDWYVKTVNNASKILKSKNKNTKILAGSTSYGGSAVYPTVFINKISKTYNNTDLFSAHPYDFVNKGILNNEYKAKINANKNIINDLGGFVKNSNTEFGGSTYTGSLTEEEQAIKIVQQYVLGDKYNIEFSIVYNFKDPGIDINEKEHNFGLITAYYYTPKKSYYSTKQYYQNTNGAEYIGTVNLAQGLEAYVYDKDGKPKIVVWASDTTKNVEINYQNFTAKDLYGNSIENINGRLTITELPIYLENIDTQYFYQAISNTAVEKYQEFQEKFAEQIAMVSGLSTEIESQKQYMKNIASVTSISQNSSIQAMENHYNLGNKLIQAYQAKELNIEYVKLSSMLDMLDDIGNSYEDLVTVSVTTRNANIQETKQKIESTEKLIEDNQDLDIVYPSKILDFSKDYYEEAKYINELQEENDIKSGLIVSKNLHSLLLAEWANTFADLYINEYIEQNPVIIEYSTQEITNKNVVATLKTDANIQIINNSGKNQYTFEDNGTFTFNYMIRGKQKAIKTTVTNIDKKNPTIKGVEQGKIYTESVTPIIEDENLQSVILKINGKIDTNYSQNTTIAEEGIYTLTAIDKAENQTTITFEIIQNLDKTYKISDGLITNIQGDTVLTKFKENLPIKTEYIVKHDGVEIKEENKISTGDVLETESGIKYTLVVAGDINKDGEVTIKDIVKLRKHLLGSIELDDLEENAADANSDSKEIGIRDLVRMRILALSRETGI